MNNTIKQIMSELEAKFAPFDQQVLESDIAFAKESFIRLQAAKAEYAHLSHNSFAYYPKLFDAAGGKTMFHIIQYGVGKGTVEFLTKNAKARSEKRNLKIAKKLQDASVTSITETNYVSTSDGFNGVYRVDTDAGEKVILINTIYAGGYNIQQAHLRVLVKVK